MKNILILNALLLLLGHSAMAQQPQKAEMIESLRVAYITKQLQLSPEEAQKFWPIYNNYQQDQNKLMRDHREKNGTELELEEKILNLRKRYRPEFTKGISEEKFDRLMKAERSWGDMVRKEMQRRQENRGKMQQNRDRLRN